MQDRFPSCAQTQVRAPMAAAVLVSVPLFSPGTPRAAPVQVGALTGPARGRTASTGQPAGPSRRWSACGRCVKFHAGRRRRARLAYVAGDDRQRGTEVGGAWGWFAAVRRDGQPVVNLGVEDGDPDAVGGARVPVTGQARPEARCAGRGGARRRSRSLRCRGTGRRSRPRSAAALLVPGGTAGRPRNRARSPGCRPAGQATTWS